jgi:hypothetical protein
MKTRLERDLQQMAQCVYSIPCECGRSYIGETGRPLAVWLFEHRHNLKQGLVEKSKLAKHAYEEGHKVGWDEARILDIESHSKYRKYKEVAHMACSIDLISQPSWTFLPSGSPLSAMRSTFHRDDLFDVTVLLGFRVESHGFTAQMMQAVGTGLASPPPRPKISCVAVHGLVSLGSFVD